jgi:hypothetical protein
MIITLGAINNWSSYHFVVFGDHHFPIEIDLNAIYYYMNFAEFYKLSCGFMWQLMIPLTESTFF